MRMRSNNVQIRKNREWAKGKARSPRGRDTTHDYISCRTTVDTIHISIRTIARGCYTYQTWVKNNKKKILLGTAREWRYCLIFSLHNFNEKKLDVTFRILSASSTCSCNLCLPGEHVHFVPYLSLVSGGCQLSSPEMPSTLSHTDHYHQTEIMVEAAHLS